MSYRVRAAFILVALFSILLSPVYADSGAPTQTSGSRIKRFFVHAYCHVFPCRSKHTDTGSPAPTSSEASKAGEVSKPATPEPANAPASGDVTAAAPDTVPAPANETAASKSAEEDAHVLLPGGGAILLKPGQKPPERKHPEYEDWSTPYLPKVIKGDASVLGKIEKNGFIRELVHVQWRDMDPIDLWVIRPTGVKKPPVILYIYGFPTNGKRYNDDNLSETLTKDGLAAVGFTSAVTGERLHDRPGRDWFVSELQESLGASVHDVQMILNYLKTRGDLDVSRVGVWGVGSGASIAIIAAAVDPRIKVLDLLNPWGDWPDWLAKSSLINENERPGFVAPWFLATVKDLEPVDWLPLLKDRQVRLQYILDGMTVTPPEVRKRMEAAAPPNVEIVHYQDAQEFAQKVDSAGRRFDWIRQQVGISVEVREANNPVSENPTKAGSSTRDAASQR